MRHGCARLWRAPAIVAVRPGAGRRRGAALPSPRRASRRWPRALLPYGIVASPAAGARRRPMRPSIRRDRYLVTLPPCPNWSKPAAGAGDFTNTPSSNFGCAAAVNLGLMVANPADLVGSPSARSDRCTSRRRGRERLPARQSPAAAAAANIGPIAVPANSAPPHRAPERAARERVAPPCSHDSRDRRNQRRPPRPSLIARASSPSCRISRRSTASSGIIRELQLDDELHLEPTLDAALRRIREGAAPRVLMLDLSDSPAPIAELSAARVGRRRAI